MTIPKYRLISLVILLSTVGCKSLNRIIDGPNPEPDKVNTITSVPPVGDAPEFNVQTPTGYDKVVFHSELVGATVKVKADATSLVRVFIKERMTGQWFALNDSYSEAFWYTFSPEEGEVTYHGQNLSLKEYCIYQYVLKS